MRYLDLRENLADQLVFTTEDIRKFDPKFFHSRLTEWQKKGYIKKIVKGHYLFSDTDLDERALFAIANKIYGPSYISLESALRYYNLIPEGVFTVTSVTTRNTRRFETTIGIFEYRKVKLPLHLGYNIVGQGKLKFKIASLEKVIIDYLYLNPDLSERETIESLRLDSYALLEKINRRKLSTFLKQAASRSLEKKVDVLLNLLDHA